MIIKTLQGNLGLQIELERSNNDTRNINPKYQAHIIFGAFFKNPVFSMRKVENNETIVGSIGWWNVDRKASRRSSWFLPELPFPPAESEFPVPFRHFRSSNRNASEWILSWNLIFGKKPHFDHFSITIFTTISFKFLLNDTKFCNF